MASVVVCTPENGFGQHWRRGDEPVQISSRRLRVVSTRSFCLRLILCTQIHQPLGSSAFTHAPLSRSLYAQACVFDSSDRSSTYISTRYHASDHHAPGDAVSYARNPSANVLHSPTRRQKSGRYGSTTGEPHRLQISSVVEDIKSRQICCRYVTRAYFLTALRTRSFHLEIVQHPIKTAEFGSSTLTRLPLAPPLIAQLHIRDHAASAIE